MTILNPLHKSLYINSKTDQRLARGFVFRDFTCTLRYRRQRNSFGKGQKGSPVRLFSYLLTRRGQG